MDTYIAWTSLVFAILLVVPTYVVKGMSSVDGFMVITQNDEVVSWCLGISGMLAEAYLEYAFTQGLVGEIATFICYHANHSQRSTIGDPFYAYLLNLLSSVGPGITKRVNSSSKDVTD